MNGYRTGVTLTHASIHLNANEPIHEDSQQNSSGDVSTLLLW